MSRPFLRLALCLCVALAFVAFGRLLPGFFRGDDFGGLAQVRDLGLADLPGVLRPWYEQAYFRPLWDLVLWGLHRAFGLWAPGYFAAAIVLHALCAALVGWLAARLGGGRGVGLWVAVLFLVHPVHAPTLGWIASLQEPLFTAGLLGALCLHLRHGETGRPWLLAGALACLAAALLAKEPAVATAPCALVLTLAARQPWRRGLLSAGAMAVLTVAWLGWRASAGALPATGAASISPARASALLADGSAWVLFPMAPALLRWPALLAGAGALALLLLRGLPAGPRAAGGMGLCGALLLLPQLPAWTGFDPFNTRLLYAPAAFLAGAAVLALAHPWRASWRGARLHALGGLAAVLLLVGLQVRLGPFVQAGRLAASYSAQLQAAVPRDEVLAARAARRGPVWFVTNKVPLPPGVAHVGHHRYVAPPFGAVELSVLYRLPLPPSLLAAWRPVPRPQAEREAVAAMPVAVGAPPQPLPGRAAFTAWLRREADRWGVEPSRGVPGVFLVFWDGASGRLERWALAEVLPGPGEGR